MSKFNEAVAVRHGHCEIQFYILIQKIPKKVYGPERKESEPVLRPELLQCIPCPPSEVESCASDDFVSSASPRDASEKNADNVEMYTINIYPPQESSGNASDSSFALLKETKTYLVKAPSFQMKRSFSENVNEAPGKSSSWKHSSWKNLNSDMEENFFFSKDLSSPSDNKNVDLEEANFYQLQDLPFEMENLPEMIETSTPLENDGFKLLDEVSLLNFDNSSPDEFEICAADGSSSFPQTINPENIDVESLEPLLFDADLEKSDCLHLKGSFCEPAEEPLCNCVEETDFNEIFAEEPEILFDSFKRYLFFFSYNDNTR